MTPGLQNAIIDSMINGQKKEAKRLLQTGCKTLPEKQAYRLARVCCALVDPEGYHKKPDLALSLMRMFKPC